MSAATRADVRRSIAATSAALNRLSSAEFEQVRVDVKRDFLAFIETEWLPEARRRAAEKRAERELAWASFNARWIQDRAAEVSRDAKAARAMLEFAK